MTKKYYPTGNEFIALPTISENGTVESINYLSMKDRGIIEITGEPFLKPVIKISGEVVPMDNLIWTWDAYWIPTFKTDYKGVTINVKYIAPQNTKGWFLRVEMRSKTKGVKASVGFNGHFGPVLHSINETKEVIGEKCVYSSLWNEGLVFDFRTGITKFSYAFLTDGGFDSQIWHQEKSEFELEKNISLCQVDSEYYSKTDIYMGIGLEEVGSTTQAIHMKRETGDCLYNQLKEWLEKRIVHIEDDHIEKILNLNQFFNYFYATGKSLDTEELALFTSRSPRYYVSAAYWDRDSLIWSFPALLETDQNMAKEALEYVFIKQIKNIGVHSRYIDGTVLEPGFELDELCAPLLALNQYLSKTNDWALLDEPYVKKGLAFIRRVLIAWKHPNIDLFGTFLMPTDDMRTYPYLTYNNVLVWKALQIFGEVYEYYKNDDLKLWSENLSKNVEIAIWNNCIVEVNNKKMFAWSTDLEGQYDFYDEPPGSLTLLEYYGFCSRDNEVLRNTIDYLYSNEFKHYFNNSNFEELGCSHADHPWVLAICNSLLNGRHKEAIDMLKRTEMDNYMACESIDENTGELVTGAHFATCAGFLVHSLLTAKKKGLI